MRLGVILVILAAIIGGLFLYRFVSIVRARGFKEAWGSAVGLGATIIGGAWAYWTEPVLSSG